MEGLPPDSYPSTQWTAIRQTSGAEDPGERERCWRSLIDAYHDPIEATLRRLMRDRAGSREDLADDFFAYLFQGQVLSKADPAVGKFRAFVQGVARNYAMAVSRSDRATSGQGVSIEPGFGPPADADLIAEEEVAWSIALLDGALDALQVRHPEQAVVVRSFHGVGATASEPAPTVRATQIAADLDITANAVSLRMRRGSQYLRQHLRRRVADSVGTPEDYEVEAALVESRIDQIYPGLLRREPLA